MQMIQKIIHLWTKRQRWRNLFFVLLVLLLLAIGIAIPLSQYVNSGRDITGCKMMDYSYSLQKGGVLHAYRCLYPKPSTKFVIDTGTSTQKSANVFMQEDTNHGTIYRKNKDCTLAIAIEFGGDRVQDKDPVIDVHETC